MKYVGNIFLNRNKAEDWCVDGGAWLVTRRLHLNIFLNMNLEEGLFYNIVGVIFRLLYA